MLISVAAEQPTQMTSHGIELLWEARMNCLTKTPSIKLPGLETVSRTVTMRGGIKEEEEDGDNNEEDKDGGVKDAEGTGGQGRTLEMACIRLEGAAEEARHWRRCVAGCGLRWWWRGILCIK